MQLRTRIAVLLVVASIVAAFLAMCADDAPPAPDPQATGAIDATERKVRTRRRRKARPPAPAEEASKDAVADAVFVDATEGAAPVTATGPTGRVRVLMLKDGRPFKGGHICFYPEGRFLEPGPWDGRSSSDGAYFGVPMYTPVWRHFDPVLGSGGPVTGFESVRGVTGRDGVVTLDVPADRPLVLFVRYADSGIPLVSQPRVNLAQGDELSLTVEAARVRTVTGRCLDSADKPLPGMWVQAVSALEERPLSRLVETSDTGAFKLDVIGEDPDVRLRAIVSYVAHPLGIHDSEQDVPPIPAETTVTGVVPGSAPVEIRVPDAPLVFIELTVAEGEPPLTHLQIEGLVHDPAAEAWGRLGGPQYKRTDGKGGRRAVIALPRADAVRPLMLWSWGWTITAVDPRGADRVSVEIPRGRMATVRGRGWRPTDRLRVIAFCRAAGQELPSIWLDGDLLGKRDQWSRGDSPVAAIEFQILRDGVVVGRSERIPPGTEPAENVRIDLD